jgi:hypothetical protein
MLRAASATAIFPPFPDQGRIAGIAVCRHRERFFRAADSENTSIRARCDNRIRPHHVVILVINPFFARNRRLLKQLEKRFFRIFNLVQGRLFQGTLCNKPVLFDGLW